MGSLHELHLVKNDGITSFDQVPGYHNTKEYLMRVMEQLPLMTGGQLVATMAQHTERCIRFLSAPDDMFRASRLLSGIMVQAVKAEIQKRMDDQDHGIKYRDKVFQADMAAAGVDTNSAEFWAQVNKYVPEDEQLQR